MASLQSIANVICKEYGVSPITIKTSNNRPSNGGLACYFTYRIKGQKKHYPKYIMIYDWDNVKGHKGEVAYRLGHELAHHIRNMSSNSLRHVSAMYNLEEKLARKISKLL